MKSFSQRYGYKKVREQIQRETIDQVLRNQLWNLLTENYFYGLRTSGGNDSKYPFHSTYLQQNKSLNLLCKDLWHDHFNKPLDTLSNKVLEVYIYLRKYYMESIWFAVYDFIEFVANRYEMEYTNKEFVDMCNTAFTQQLSAYRFINRKIVEITSEQEIQEIEKAIEISPSSVQQHLSNSLDKLSNKTNPDYRNSIKESISAVESLCKLITGDDKATLSKALTKIQSEGTMILHPSLKTAFDKIYGYTSNEGGIRHSLIDEDSNVDLEEARFMLVTCSAFINYLKVKADKAGIELGISNIKE